PEGSLGGRERRVVLDDGERARRDEPQPRRGGVVAQGLHQMERAPVGPSMARAELEGRRLFSGDDVEAPEMDDPCQGSVGAQAVDELSEVLGVAGIEPEGPGGRFLEVLAGPYAHRAVSGAREELAQARGDPALVREQDPRGRSGSFRIGRRALEASLFPTVRVGPAANLLGDGGVGGGEVLAGEPLREGDELPVVVVDEDVPREGAIAVTL